MMATLKSMAMKLAYIPQEGALDKKQFVFLYRSREVEVVRRLQADVIESVFERPPFSVLFRTIKERQGQNSF
jgi:hypothetical protein